MLFRVQNRQSRYTSSAAPYAAWSLTGTRAKGAKPRPVSTCRRAFDVSCERCVSSPTSSGSAAYRRERKGDAVVLTLGCAKAPDRWVCKNGVDCPGAVPIESACAPNAATTVVRAGPRSPSAGRSRARSGPGDLEATRIVRSECEQVAHLEPTETPASPEGHTASQGLVVDPASALLGLSITNRIVPLAEALRFARGDIDRPL